MNHSKNRLGASAGSKEALVQHIISFNQSRKGALSWDNTVAFHLDGDHLWRVKETCYKRNRATPLAEWARQVHQGRRIELYVLHEKPPEQGTFLFLGEDAGGWGYHLKSEFDCDNEGIYSCPPTFLDLVPRGHPAWREKVRAWHAARRGADREVSHECPDAP